MVCCDLYSPLAGFTLSLLVYLSQCTQDHPCTHKIWDEAHDGKGVKKLDLDCLSGSVEWNAPYGGLFVNIIGPAKEHQLCIQASSIGTSALVSTMGDNLKLKRMITINEPKQHKQQQKHTMCVPAYKDTLLFVEPDIGAFVSSKVIMDYYIETQPRYGEDACRPCTDEELLYNYCASDFVAVGRMHEIKSTPAANIISVTLDLIKHQSTKHFAKISEKGKIYHTGQLYTPAQCKMHNGDGKFVFMGKMKFNRAELRCAPTYEDFQELQRRSKLKGTTLCT